MTKALKHIPITKQVIVDKLYSTKGYYMQKTKKGLSMEDSLEMALDDLNDLLKKGDVEQ